MTLERSASIMDDIFHSSDLESRGRLLRIMHDFLVSESMKQHEEQKGEGPILCPCTILIIRRRRQRQARRGSGYGGIGRKH